MIKKCDRAGCGAFYEEANVPDAYVMMKPIPGGAEIRRRNYCPDCTRFLIDFDKGATVNSVKEKTAH